LETFDGKVLTSGEAPVKVKAQAATQVCKLDLSDRLTDDNIRSLVFIAELFKDGQFISRETAYFAPIKHLSLIDPALSADLHEKKGQLVINVTSRTLALRVEVSLAGSDVVFSDNYFNLPADRTAIISCPMPAGWTLRQAQNAFRLRSVFDSYSHEAEGLTP
jgi:beta-mannosidase